MSDNINIETPKTPGSGKILVGILLLVVGVGFLLQQMHFYLLPYWLFRWPMWLIIWGLYSGARHNFRNSAWLIMTLVGLAFLMDDAFPDYNVSDFIWPIAIIVFGLWLILKRSHHWDGQDNWGQKWERKWESKWEDKWNKHKYTPFEPVSPAAPGDAPNDPSSTASAPESNPLKGDDYLDAVSVFGGVKKTIVSKNFRGGEIVNVFGGTELDFTHADINGRVVIDITQIFGGTKIIVPGNWQVVSDIAAVFASVDDKRMNGLGAAKSQDKILVLKGTSIFAGVDVRSY